MPCPCHTASPEWWPTSSAWPTPSRQRPCARPAASKPRCLRPHRRDPGNRPAPLPGGLLDESRRPRPGHQSRLPGLRTPQEIRPQRHRDTGNSPQRTPAILLCVSGLCGCVPQPCWKSGTQNVHPRCPQARHRYRYDRPVSLGPGHPPAPLPHCRTPVLAYSLRVDPASTSSTGSRTPSPTTSPGGLPRRPTSSPSRWTWWPRCRSTTPSTSSWSPAPSTFRSATSPTLLVELGPCPTCSRSR